MTSQRPVFLVLPFQPMAGTERFYPRTMVRPPLGL